MKCSFSTPTHPETPSTQPNQQQQKQHHGMDSNVNMHDDGDYIGRLSNNPCLIVANEVCVDQRLKQKQEGVTGS